MKRSSRVAASDNDLGLQIAAGAHDLLLPLPDGAIERLVGYLRLLERWNATYNLTAIRDPIGIVVHHIIDSLAAAASLLRHRSPDATRRLLDVGSGAGLPGLVLAVACPGIQVLCVDKVAKKTAFISYAAASLGLENLQAFHAAVEDMQSPKCEVIASRALGSLNDLVSGTRHLLAEGGEWMAMKGKAPLAEIRELTGIRALLERLQVPQLNAERCIVWMTPEHV